MDRREDGAVRLAALDRGLRVLPAELAGPVLALGRQALIQAEELRLRRGRPVAVNLAGTERETAGPPVTEEDLRTVVENASQASAHTVLDQVRNGFVTLRGGHRLGLCGTVARQGERIITLRYLTSLALRLACQAEGPDLEDAVENARDAAYNWLMVEIEEETYEFPSQTHVEDMDLPQGAFVKQIRVTVKLMPDND